MLVFNKLLPLCMYTEHCTAAPEVFVFMLISLFVFVFVAISVFIHICTAGVALLATNFRGLRPHHPSLLVLSSFNHVFLNSEPVTNIPTHVFINEYKHSVMCLSILN